AHPSVLLSPSSLRGLAQLIGGFFPPDLSPSFLLIVARAAVRTLSLAVAGTLLAVLAGVPLGVLASRRIWQRGPLADDAPPRARALAGAVCLAIRAFLRFVRAVPDVAWALLFVAGLGLGPLPGVLALGVSNGGIIGRVAADLFDAVPDEPARALRAA